MTLQQLKYVIEVANRGSMNEAAKRLFISQPSLSNAIKDLEEELNITIFERTNKGITLSKEGAEFLGYARQVTEQAELLESRYMNAKPSPQHFSVSTQHYAFAVNAFVHLVNEYGQDEYELALRETKTHEIIQDVKSQRSEIGILYLNEFNSKVINRLLKDANLKFTSLFTARPHIFISIHNPLAKQSIVTIDQLQDYPYLSFEQGEYNSFHFSEEILSTLTHPKSIRVNDRATLFNLLIGLNGYTISTGVLSADLNGNEIIPVPLDCDETINVGWICHQNAALSKLALEYIEALHQAISD
ncbi:MULTISPECIES: LysR family transcriptional regulator [Paenibacillus]|uniref:DNA-binding transcriptional LysR family regulator n=3 Tax=Paenibacillus TaxID=44249 RepID=A0A1R1ERE9_9BACL|nr:MULTISPECIES: LysR family transcriptional regulator [Paenibacillus]MBB3128981.1 DNA-binding transcriptional LysR family regulator [Paenibacillus rhizosphaerae]MCM2996691.1 LysR family transcriptional regulator [Paenibacillus cellulositrophicus]OMF54416.1 LysR family transcriptional regulator [Paenibacillus rhizosphaerae]OXL82190.1 LysR family transcriptional regulator [Paenibacillus sp. SSG-1]UYO04214.1 LysR family transcriptional regulator [Paenibacillus sp. PSB04]